MQGTITKKGSKWYIVVDLGRDNNGKRKQKWLSGFRTKKEAQLKLPEILVQLNNNTFVDTENISLGKYLEQWLKDYAKPNTAATTYDKYFHTCKRISAEMGDIQLHKVKPMHIQNFLNSLDLAPRTILDYYTTLNTAFNTAINWQVLNTNPCNGVKRPKQEKNKMKVYTEAEVGVLLDGIKDHVLYTVILLAITCGLRRGEILGLQWENIDFRNSLINLENSIVRANNKNIMKDTKSNAGKRSISVSKSVLEVLKKIRKKQMEYSLALGTSYQKSNFVCTWPDGRPINPDYVTKTYSKIIKSLGLPHIRFHDLRHTHATLLLKDGVHPKIVQERLGHSKISVTLDTYSHVLPNMQKEAAEKIDKILMLEEC